MPPTFVKFIEKLFFIAAIMAFILVLSYSVSHAQMVKISYPCDTTIYKDSSYTITSYRYDTTYKEKCKKFLWIKYDCEYTIKSIVKTPVKIVVHEDIPIIIKRTCWKDTCMGDQNIKVIPVVTLSDGVQRTFEQIHHDYSFQPEEYIKPSSLIYEISPLK